MDDWQVSNYKMGPLNSASSSPTPDLFRQTATLQVQMPHQANVISVEDDEFSTDDEHVSSAIYIVSSQTLCVGVVVKCNVFGNSVAFFLLNRILIESIACVCICMNK